MNTTTRAWKDPAFRATLGEAELAALPASPAGMADLSDGQLDATDGGTGATVWCATVVVCVTFSLARECTLSLCV